jgi:hypothetical protein
MPQRYFDKFPTITYSNTEVVDITRRVAVLDRVISNPYIYFPYEIAEEERADQFSERYYEDSYQSWLVYMSNKITDPYYEWYLTETEFIEFLNKKYGDYYVAQEKIKYYTNDYETSDQITPGGFSALTPCMQRYWEPVFGVGSNIIAYKRREITWDVSTNKIISYGVSNTSFIKDELVTIVFGVDDTGRGQVVNAANNLVYVQHVSGSFFPDINTTITANSYIYGQESSVNTVFTSATALANNISEEELVYWKPVTYYEYEYNKNAFPVCAAFDVIDIVGLRPRSQR